MMNIKQRKKENLEKKEEEKIIKLAIGKPGGAQIPGDDYEQIIEVKCLACKKTLKYEQDEDLLNLVNAILNSSSENEKQEIKEWEEKILPCEHTLTLKQTEGVIIKEKSIAKCNDCDLKKNLWLCLSCGNLSCGRRETGGNQHAIEHYNKLKHPLVVKTGTITPDGEASLYCYACDNDVKDENLALHLKNLGIDINEQKKTDKTITEINLSFNINFTLSKTIEEGKVLTPLYGKGFTGLENLGNSCYMNSVIQILFHLEPFIKRYYDNAIDHLNICTADSSKCFECQMSKIFYGLHSGLYSQKKTRHLPPSDENKEGEIEEYQDGIRPSSFKYYFGKGNPDFSSNKQQDAFEYLSYLLEKMKKEENRIRKFNPMKLFEFDLESRMECNGCHNVKYKTTRTWFLTLSVNDWKNKKEETSKYTIDEALSKFLSPEEVELICPECKKSTHWTKTQRILNYPSYLIIIFQRFIFDWVPVKLEVSFEPTLDNFDIKSLSQSHKKENEIILDSAKEEAFEKELKEKEKEKEKEKSNENSNNEEEFEEQEIEFNQDDINYLLQYQIPELGAKWSLYLCNNDREAALGFYCENSENPEYKVPLPKIKVKKSKNDKEDLTGVNLASLSSLLEMGMERKKSIAALKKAKGNIEEAVKLIFSDPILGEEEEENKKEEENKNEKKEDNNPKKEEKMDVEEEDKNINENNGSIYNMYGFITHLGKNTEHGHYVCHIRKEGKDWIYFNDNKVTLWEQPPIKKGYIYFYRNISNDNK